MAWNYANIDGICRLAATFKQVPLLESCWILHNTIGKQMTNQNNEGDDGSDCLNFYKPLEFIVIYAESKKKKKKKQIKKNTHK